MQRLQRMLGMAEAAAAEPEPADVSGPVSPEEAQARDLQALARLVLAMRARLHLLDPRLQNRPALRGGEIPAANGHFSARALARFYACLGQPLASAPALPAEASAGSPPLPRQQHALPTLLPPDRLCYATQPHCEERQQTNLFVQGGPRTVFGLGWQLLGRAGPGSSKAQEEVGPTQGHRGGFSADVPADGGGGAGAVKPVQLAFGHSGFGGSIAFYIPSVDASVAITVNQLTQDKGATAALVAEALHGLGAAPLAAAY